MSSRKVLIVVAAVGLLFLLLNLFWIYGAETQHQDRSSIWWTERGQGLIPPTATGITLQQDFLDHYATYKVNENDLVAFLEERFGYFNRAAVNSDQVGQPIGRFRWIVKKGTIEYSSVASNGGVHKYFHDPKTGLTYQSSAYW